MIATASLPRPGFLKRRFLAFRREALLLWFAFRHPATPWHLRAASLAAGLYLLSPIDLVPVTVPLLGVVDDLLIVPLAVSLIAGALPAAVEADSARRADAAIARWLRRPLVAAAAIGTALLAIWLGVLVLLWQWLAG
ncbi:YkvA family protein [Roseococcus sp. YIM B11640]|uniref:YkvA family protein n=1 Tax=Roseococcus sp. YIM B11640 TaxID=3133973 RepID=UPI003C7E3884